MENKKFDKEYATSFYDEVLYLRKCGIRYEWVYRNDSGVSVWKYRKTYKTLEGFSRNVQKTQKYELNSGDEINVSKVCYEDSKRMGWAYSYPYGIREEDFYQMLDEIYSFCKIKGLTVKQAQLLFETASKYIEDTALI